MNDPVPFEQRVFRTGAIAGGIALLVALGAFKELYGNVLG